MGIRTKVREEMMVLNLSIYANFYIFPSGLAEQLLSVFFTVFVCNLRLSITNLIASSTYLRIQ